MRGATLGRRVAAFMDIARPIHRSFDAFGNGIKLGVLANIAAPQIGRLMDARDGYAPITGDEGSLTELDASARADAERFGDYYMTPRRVEPTPPPDKSLGMLGHAWVAPSGLPTGPGVVRQLLAKEEPSRNIEDRRGPDPWWLGPMAWANIIGHTLPDELRDEGALDFGYYNDWDNWRRRTRERRRMGAVKDRMERGW